MLVLTRKSQDSIRIGGNITVTVLRIKGNTVRIGIEAPESVRIVRGELPDFNSFVEESPATLSGQQTRGDNAESNPLEEEAQPSPPSTASRLKKYIPAIRQGRYQANLESQSPLPRVQDLPSQSTPTTFPPR
jgi:carbon storage regulator CsrA